MSNKEIVVASGNPGKLQEFSRMFADYDVRVLPQSAFAVPAVAETGASFAENALLKARHGATHARRPVIADDSGIEVDALDGAPGIYSARYAGVGAADADNLRLLLRNIAATGVRHPPARFRCVIAYVREARDPEPLLAHGVWEGYITDEPAGANGFGYDPVFYVPDHGCTAAQLSPTVKNSISHRGQALRHLAELMKEAQAFA
ncbi:MAG: RdgB/HAM1 family non-canonical purine NTP pyrophosphatase [Gammaproteobacteria bacterium]|nr:RdgB/HAM1 family non-canonical purine NTP pyrophosphatase [Gammaproteobacteria bacterium]MCY4338631.1 RdgB/HAM1 family non-canonical purine NTP pyrophosphatase [Gammaproteobacteria bacterium]